MIPRKAGDRVKTDRRDAEMLARLWRAGELTPIWTPDEEQEAMRDLIRTRKQAMDAVKVAKQQLLSFLLRHGLRYQNGSYWTKRHRRWLAELRRFRVPHQQLAFEELKRAVDQSEARVATMDKAIEEAIQTWRFAPVVDALRALRGVNTIIAATVVAEIGDITRFEKGPRPGSRSARGREYGPAAGGGRGRSRCRISGRESRARYRRGPCSARRCPRRSGPGRW